VQGFEYQLGAQMSRHSLAHGSAAEGEGVEHDRYHRKPAQADDPGISRRPLICVNTANHPVAVASAFWHELGHHLTNRTFDVSHPLWLSFSSSYEDHLGNPLEIAADMVSALAVYPKPVARHLFGGFVKTGKAPDIDGLVSIAKMHLRSVAGFDFQPSVPATENLHYLVGMMHFIRLRWVLFSEYEI
jgi:hypothetical protein